MISKFFLSLVLVFTLLDSVMANVADPKQTTITCKVNRKTESGVFLYKVENGEAVSLGFLRPDEIADTCIFSLTLEKEGVYFIRKAGVHSSEFKHVIYLKPGDNKWVNLYLGKVSIDFDSCKIKNPNKETVYLQNWNERFNDLCKLSTARTKREEFIRAYNQVVKDAAGLKVKAVPANRYFNSLFADKLDADIQWLKAASFFYNGERLIGGCDTTAERKQFYQSLAVQKFCDARLLQSEHGLQLVKFTHGYQLFQLYPTPQQMQQVMMSGSEFASKAKSICNDAVRAAYVFDRMEQLNNYESFKRDVEPFKDLFTTKAYQAAYQKKKDQLTVYAKGAPAYNFSLEDTKGQMVSLSDFKGRVVVLDVWAMWCGPCLQERPNYQKLEEEYKGRDDIVFLGISHDGLAKKDLWKKFVAKKGWKNIELIANYDESVGKYYKIEGIPRFMIFDKEGKIVSVDAPRPSDPALKKLIEETLKANS